MHLLWLLLPLVPAVLPHPTNESQELFWGMYRPNLYFGLRPRVPQSLMTGFMWFGTQDFQSVAREFETSEEFQATIVLIETLRDQTCL